MDAMCIKKQIVWDQKIHKFVGYCDFGGELQIEGPETAATEALVFMLVSLTGKWKIPVGYVFQNKVNAVSQAELIKSSLVLAHQSGLRVWGVTCDGAFTNFSTFKILGCNMKLSLKFANKLTSVHIGWKNNKMKVKLAAQLLSSSTAKALQYLKDNNFQRFGDCEATNEYCKSTDQIFIILNSRCSFSKGYKSPIFKSNIHFLQDKIMPLINYLSTLKLKNQLLYTTNKKTLILGFTAAVRSIFEISKNIFTENLNFKYILTYNFSQDHIEMLFGRIRQRYGTNNNPIVVQFKTAMKQILIKNSIKCSENSNCNSFDNDVTASIFSFTHNSKN
ncbi:hypothetical protein QTP88_023868 [Uroleucon formosanum]